MSQTIVHNMDNPWTSSNPAALSVSADSQLMISGAASNHIVSGGGALAAFAEFVPGALLDLSQFDELRFWVRASLPADGSSGQPFVLEFSYVDQNDAAGEQHQWFVPVNLKNTWEQRRIGIESDRRSAINRLRFTSLSNGSFSYYIDEFLAVRDEMLADVEQTLVSRLEEQSVLPGLANAAIDQNAAAGATQIRLPLTDGFNVGNRILVQGGSAGDETHDVVAVQNDTVANHTTLTFAATDALRGNLTAGAASVTLLVPVIIETAAAPQSFDATPPGAPIRPSPAFLLSLLDAREDLSRTNYEPQRDSFRRRGAAIVCSVRAPARAYLADYQVMPIAPERPQELFLRNLVVQRLSMDIPLSINGAFSSVYILPPPALVFRQIGQPTSVYVRIYTRLETAVRQVQVWVRRMTVDAAPLDAPADEEEIVVDL
jgi:hypothetical protein